MDTNFIMLRIEKVLGNIEGVEERGRSRNNIIPRFIREYSILISL